MQLLLTVNSDVLHLELFYQNVCLLRFFARWLGDWFCSSNVNFKFSRQFLKMCTRSGFVFAKYVLNGAKQTEFSMINCIKTKIESD